MLSFKSKDSIDILDNSITVTLIKKVSDKICTLLNSVDEVVCMKRLTLLIELLKSWNITEIESSDVNLKDCEFSVIKDIVICHDCGDTVDPVKNSVKKYKCQECHKVYGKCFNLMRHLLDHNSEKGKSGCTWMNDDDDSENVENNVSISGNVVNNVDNSEHQLGEITNLMDADVNNGNNDKNNSKKKIFVMKYESRVDDIDVNINCSDDNFDNDNYGNNNTENNDDGDDEDYVPALNEEIKSHKKRKRKHDKNYDYVDVIADDVMIDNDMEDIKQAIYLHNQNGAADDIADDHDDEDSQKMTKYKTNYGCHICARRFRRRNSLHKHLALHKINPHSGEVKDDDDDGLSDCPLLCSDCGKTFESFRKFKDHSYTHSEPSKLTCTKCPKKEVNMLKRRSYTPDFKVSVINYAKMHSNRAASRKFDVHEKNVREWRKDEIKWTKLSQDKQVRESLINWDEEIERKKNHLLRCADRQGQVMCIERAYEIVVSALQKVKKNKVNRRSMKSKLVSVIRNQMREEIIKKDDDVPKENNNEEEENFIIFQNGDDKNDDGDDDLSAKDRSVELNMDPDYEYEWKNLKISSTS